MRPLKRLHRTLGCALHVCGNDSSVSGTTPAEGETAEAVATNLELRAGTGDDAEPWDDPPGRPYDQQACRSQRRLQVPAAHVRPRAVACEALSVPISATPSVECRRACEAVYRNQGTGPASWVLIHDGPFGSAWAFKQPGNGPSHFRCSPLPNQSILLPV